MRKDLLKFEHIGLAVKDFTAAVRFYESLGYQCSAPIVDDLQRVELIMCRSDTMPDVELIKPTGDDSPVGGILKERPEALYHTCFEVSDLGPFLKDLKRTNRVLTVSPPKQAILFGNRHVSFYYVQGVGLLELLES